MRKVSPSWPRVTLSIDGASTPAIAPLVISASRATDIPALYGEWLVEQFTRGYTCWTNPFNGQVQYVSLDNTEVIAFWSKNPSPFFPNLDFFDKRDTGYFFQYTLNNYEAEQFEPGLPPLATRIESLQTLAQRIGKNRVHWRFDPIIITPEVSAHTILAKIEYIGDRISHSVARLTVSFLSHYRHVTQTLNRGGIHPFGRTEEVVREIGEGLARLSHRWGLDVYTCAEEADMSRFGILPGSCIDPVYLLRTFGDTNPKLSAFLMNEMPEPLFPSAKKLTRAVKDPGQRKRCNCMLSKDIGTYGTCTLGCRYCYAGGSRTVT